MAKKTHPADLAQAAIIGNAIRYDVALFLGVGRFAHGTAATLAEARIEAMRLAAEHPDNVRKPMIYAIEVVYVKFSKNGAAMMLVMRLA